MTDNNSSKPKLTEKQESFVRALFTEEVGGDLALALKAAGYADSVKAADVLNSDAVAEAIRDHAKYYLSANAGKAVFELVKSLSDPSKAGIQNQLKAIQMILDRVGVKDKEDTGPVENKAGVVYLPEKVKRVIIETDE